MNQNMNVVNRNLESIGQLGKQVMQVSETWQEFETRYESVPVRARDVFYTGHLEWRCLRAPCSVVQRTARPSNRV